MNNAPEDLSGSPPTQVEIDVLMVRGRETLQRRQFDDALAVFEQILTFEPDNVNALAGRGDAYFKKEQYAQSLADFERALQLRPGDSLLLLGRAKAHFESNEDEETIADCNLLLEMRPAWAEAVCYRGAAYLCIGEHETAFDELNEAIRLDPMLPTAYFFRGRAFAEEDDYDAALADYTTAIRLDPQYGFPYEWRAFAWDALDETDRALEDRAVAFQLRPPNANSYHSRAHSWQGRDEDQKAIADFTEAIRLEPNNTRHYNCRANAFLSMGEDDKADADLEMIQRIEAGEEEGDMNATLEQKMLIYNLVQEHFAQAPLDKIAVTERTFPARVGADLQRALDQLGEHGHTVVHFFAVHQGGQAPYSFSNLYNRDRRNPPLSVPPQSIEIDIGEEEPVRCLKFGLWMLRCDGVNYLVMLETERHQGIHFEVAAVAGPQGQTATQQFFRHLEDAVQKGSCYRGKVLSLEYQEMYSGQSCGILVHKLRPIQRDQVILPPPTLDLLDRNIVQFVRQRPRLAALGLATKKGLLFYGPPGTGKTHTIHYLARAIEGQTTFLISAEQVGMLGEYMTLARLFQPSMVVIEDVDLIARDRTTMHSAGEEALLNKLLNEMDGLKAETDILFVLTTNRPEKLEEALASRPGRIDQAIEFPLPDADGRFRLVRLYSRQVEVPEEVVRTIVKKTDRVSASFIKELMRRATQFYLERDGTGPLELPDIENALEEMLFRGGSLNRMLLGAVDHPSHSVEE